MGTEIPLWIGGLQKWVTGVTKQTTCDDIVRAVLASNDEAKNHKSKRDSKNYLIVERWHKVERPLDSKSRILKVWNTWGLEQCNVRFLLKKCHPSTPKDIKAHKRKQGKAITKSAKTWHPRKVRSESEDDHDFPATTDQLKNLIASQGETLSTQMRRLQEKDEEIEFFETQIHMQRMHQIGVNYVQDTYLAESSEGDSWSSGSGSGSQPTDASCDILDHCIELYEKVLQLCDKVQQEEDCIRELTTQLKQTVSLRDNDNGTVKTDRVDDPEFLYAGPERLEEMLKRTKNDLERLMKVNETQQQTINQNEQTLAECTKIIEDKHCYLQHLKCDLDKLDKDNMRLQEEFSAIQTIPVESVQTCDVPEAGDNNSDTGLSSLHSSSDDGACVLDTLV